MKQLTPKGLLLLFTLIISFSCKREKILGPATSQKAWDETAKAVAFDVSKKLNSLSFRKMLKHEVLLRFDGDANILLSAIVKRWPKYLAYEAARNSATRTENEDLLAYYSFDILAEAAETYPQMQLAVQTDADSWDAEVYIPSVVYMPADYDEATTLTISGYDPYQNPITVSAVEEPVVNYVVVSQNERTTYRDGSLQLTSSTCPIEPILSNAPYDPEVPPRMLEPDNCEGTGGTGGGGGGSAHPQYVGVGQDGVLPTLVGSQAGTVVPPPANGTFNRLQPIGTFNGTVVYRKDFRHEKMREIRCDNLSEIEGWPAGDPEIRVHVFEQNVLNPSETLQIFKEQFRPRKRKYIKGKWWDAEGVTLHLWDYNGTGTKTSFGYYEYDAVLIPNEALVSIGEVTVDLLFLQTVNITTTTNQMTIYGNIRQSISTGIRSLKRKNGMSEYIGKDDYSIFNDEDQFNHNPGGTKFKTWPDL